MSFLCTARNKEVSYHQCINECQYFFKSGCIDKMNEAYNQALDDFREKINNFLNDSAYFYDSVVTDGAIDCVIDELKK